jgi:hypothetical protein
VCLVRSYAAGFEINNFLGIIGFILLVWGYSLISQDHVVLTTNGTREMITRAEHPKDSYSQLWRAF